MKIKNGVMQSSINSQLPSMGHVKGRHLSNVKKKKESSDLIKAVQGMSQTMRRLIRDQKASGLDVTFMEGRQIIKESPDGTRIIMDRVAVPPYKLPSHVILLKKLHARQKKLPKESHSSPNGPPKG